MDFAVGEDELAGVLKEHKLSSRDYENILKIMGRKPNLVELGIFSAMWSEHCSYKSSKAHLKDLPTSAEWVVQGPGENAGIIDIGENTSGEKLVAVFKVESHNHPSFIEPHAGAATGVGGIMRDILTMGAEPAATLDVLCLGNINGCDRDNVKLHRTLLDGVVAGIGHYGNCMGVPTVGGEVNLDSCFDGNILVNAFNIGITRGDRVFYSKASGAGNSIVYVGAKTGRDGLGGAVMSSGSFESDGETEGEPHKRNHRHVVQIGDPFMGRLLMEACMEVFNKNIILGIQDMGAAGLTSSSFEMADKGGCGVTLWLDKVPTRENGMSPYEIMLSESQERMLICAEEGKEQEIIDIFERHGLDAAVVGMVTDSGKVDLEWRGKVCASIEVKSIVQNAPVIVHPTSKPAHIDHDRWPDILWDDGLVEWAKRQDSKIDSLQQAIGQVIKSMLKDPAISDKGYVYTQYDSSIRNSTIKGPGLGGASVINLQNYGSTGALSICAKSRSSYCHLNPRIGARIITAQAGRKVAVTGARPMAISDCLNFGSPENPEVMYAFKECCQGIKEACIALKTPVVSGNVSFYNQTGKIPIYPTPVIVSVGVIQDHSLVIPSHFVSSDSVICMVGKMDKDSLSGSVFQRVTERKLSGRLTDVDLEHEAKLWEYMQEVIADGLVRSARDIGDGGISMCVIKSAIVKRIGCEIDVSIDKSIFSETQGCVICEVDPKNLETMKNKARRVGIEVDVIGRSTDSKHARVIKLGDLELDSKELADIYYGSFQEVMKENTKDTKSSENPY